MTRKFALALLTAVIGLSGTSATAVDSAPVARASLRQALDSDQAATLDGRRKLAAAVGEYCIEVDRAYPKNSPREHEWLLGKINGGGERPRQAAASAEMGRLMAANFVEGCGQWVGALERQPDSPRLYTGLAYTFVRFMGDAEFFARKNGIDPDLYAFGTAPRVTIEALLLASLNAKGPPN